MNEIMIYSAVLVVLMVAASTMLTSYCASVMTRTHRPMLISVRRRRNRLMPEVEQHPGGPYRSPGRRSDDAPALEQVAAVAARFSPVRFDGAWFDGVSVEKVFVQFGRFLVRAAICAALLGLAVPLLPGATFTGGVGTALGLGALYCVCLFAAALLHAGSLLAVLKFELIPSRFGAVLFIAVWLLSLAALPMATLKIVDVASSSFDVSGWFATIAGGLVMWIANIKIGVKSRSDNA